MANKSDQEKARDSLLLKMYDQMFNDINRHILVVWQSIGVLAGAITLLALVQKQAVPLDVAIGLIVLVGYWSLFHLEDASYWYNRNLVIIANIERQFLVNSDLRDIHYYFGAHRPSNRMITHIKIQYVLGIGIIGLMLGYHFVDRVLPGLSAPLENFEPIRSLPYLVSAALLIVLFRIKSKRRKSYDEFIENSPGVAIDTHGIRYGVGHGFDDRSESVPRATVGQNVVQADESSTDDRP